MKDKNSMGYNVDEGGIAYVSPVPISGLENRRGDRVPLQRNILRSRDLLMKNKRMIRYGEEIWWLGRDGVDGDVSYGLEHPI